MAISVREGTTTVVYRQRLEFEKVDENAFVYRLLRFTESIRQKGPVNLELQNVTNIQQGVVGEANLIRITRGKPLISSPIAMIDDDGLRELALYGFRTTRIADQTLFVKEPFNQYTSGALKRHNVVEVDADNRMIFNQGMRRKWFTGDALPIAMYFNYKNADLDDEHYDLDLLVEYLTNHQPSILVTAQRGHVEAPIARKARSSYDAIYYVESNDQTWTRRRCISIVWLPSKEIYRAVWKLAQDQSHCDMYQAALEFDAFGLKQSGAGLISKKIGG